jgi:hypothetical protein
MEIVTIALIIILTIVALYYGIGQNLEVASRMLTRELIDTERTQKVRIIKGHGKLDVSDAEWKKSVERINKIDDLDI